MKWDTLNRLLLCNGARMFSGRFGEEIVRFNTLKSNDGKISSITLHVPIK
jgi:hypothetical protein